MFFDFIFFFWGADPIAHAASQCPRCPSLQETAFKSLSFNLIYLRIIRRPFLLLLAAIQVSERRLREVSPTHKHRLCFFLSAFGVTVSPSSSPSPFCHPPPGRHFRCPKMRPLTKKSIRERFDSSKIAKAKLISFDFIRRESGGGYYRSVALSPPWRRNM